MYEEFYGLREKLFNKTPDPRFLYQSAKHAEALARLQLDVDETREYVKYRVSVAGKEAPLFDEEALTAMFEHSGGVPRLINIIAGNALVEGFGKGVDIIGQEIIESVVKDHWKTIVN